MLVDERQFPIRYGLPHIFRASGEWRVWVDTQKAIFDIDGYRARVEAARNHLRKLSGLPPLKKAVPDDEMYRRTARGDYGWS